MNLGQAEKNVGIQGQCLRLVDIIKRQVNEVHCVPYVQHTALIGVQLTL